MKSLIGALLGLALFVPMLAQADDIARQAQVLITQQVQAQRAKLAPGATPFTADPTLAEIARGRAAAMANGLAPLSHTDASGRYPAYDAVRARFPNFKGQVGENIAVGSGSAAVDANGFAQDTIEHWMASTGHRGNILSAGFSRVGIGVAINGNTGYAVAVFTGP